MQKIIEDITEETEHFDLQDGVEVSEEEEEQNSGNPKRSKLHSNE